MSETYYKKQNGKYIPIGSRDPSIPHLFPFGATLVISAHNTTSYTYNVDPAFAPLIAAGKYAEEAMATAIVNTMSTPRADVQLSEDEQKLYNDFIAMMRRHTAYWYYPSATESARAGVNVLIEEAETLLENPSVREAYEQFLLIAKLTQENNNEK